MPSKQENEALIHLIASNRELAFEKIVSQYSKRLYWHIRNIVLNHQDADDVLQEVFIKVWKALDKFRADSSLFTWLYRIATNESLNFLRQKKRRFFLSLADIEQHLIQSLESDVYFSGSKMELLLHKAVAKLPEKQRIVFIMKYFEELKYSEMAEILNLSEGALKANYHHAVKKIREFVELNVPD